MAKLTGPIQRLGAGNHLPLMQQPGGKWWLAGGIHHANARAVYKPKGAASLADSYVDQTGKGNAVSVGVAPTWTADGGWAFNGTTQYLDTGIVPAETMTMMVRYGGVTDSGSGAGVFENAVGGFYFMPQYFGGWTFYQWGDSDDSGGSLGDLSAGGTQALAANKAYVNGKLFSDIYWATWTPLTETIYVGAHNFDGVAADFFGGTVLAMAIYDVVLSAEQVAAVHLAMMAL